MGNDELSRHHYRTVCIRKVIWSDGCDLICWWMMLWKGCGCHHRRHVLCWMEDDVDGHWKHFRDETCGVWMKFHCFHHWMMVEMGARPLLKV